MSPHSSKPYALVTGASRGIGAAIAEALAQKGHPIILNYRTQHDAAQQVASRIQERGGKVVLAPFDVSSHVETSRALEELLRECSPIGIVVHNAGIVRDGPLPTLTFQDWSSVIRTSLDGFYNVTQPLVMSMVHARWGRIIAISSISGTVGNRGQVNYSAAKAGLIGACRSLAKEVAKRGVTVNAVAPGLIETDMVAELPKEALLKMIPMRRFGTPQEVAGLVDFLVSDAAAYITGQVITIDGGLV